MVMCKDGTTVATMGNIIHVSNGEMYTFSGGMLIGPSGFVSMNVSSISEAAGIVIGLHGGRKL